MGALGSLFSSGLADAGKTFGRGSTANRRDGLVRSGSVRVMQDVGDEESRAGIRHQRQN